MGYALLGNNVQGTLTSGINGSVTAMSVTLDAGSKSYPATVSASTPLYLTISDPDNPLLNEIVKCTAVSGANVTTMVRAQRGTSALTWATGSKVSLNLHAQDITERSDTLNPGAGTVGAPSLFLSTDTTTGLYRSGANEIALSISGTYKAKLTATAFSIVNGLNVGGVTKVSDGTAAAPSITFTTDADNGFYFIGSNTVGVAAGGVKCFSFGAITNAYTDFNLTRDAASAINFYAYVASTAHGRMNFFSARGTESAPASLASADEVGAIYVRSWGTGSTFNISGKAQFLATEAHSSTAAGTKFQIHTTPNTSVTAALALEVGQDKKLTTYGPIEIPSANGIYFGGTTTEGSWRFIRSGDDLLVQRYESSTWTTKTTITAA